MSMPTYLAGRLLAVVPVVFVISLLAFGREAITPGDPAYLLLHLDDPAAGAVPGLGEWRSPRGFLGAHFARIRQSLSSTPTGSATRWPSYARLSGAPILRERSQQYVDGAVALGADRLRIVVRHILPRRRGRRHARSAHPANQVKQALAFM